MLMPTPVKLEHVARNLYLSLQDIRSLQRAYVCQENQENASSNDVFHLIGRRVEKKQSGDPLSTHIQHASAKTLSTDVNVQTLAEGVSLPTQHICNGRDSFCRRALSTHRQNPCPKGSADTMLYKTYRFIIDFLLTVVSIQTLHCVEDIFCHLVGNAMYFFRGIMICISRKRFLPMQDLTSAKIASKQLKILVNRLILNNNLFII